MSRSANIINSMVPISQFNRGQASRIFDRLHTENQLVVLKNNQPAAVILSPEEFYRLSEVEEDYNMLIKALVRLERSDSKTYSIEDVMKELGINTKDIDNADDVIID